MKGVADDIERLTAVVHQDFDDVEAETHLGIVEHAQPRDCSPGNQLLFVRVHGRGRGAVSQRSPRFDFDKDESGRLSLAADNVDFASPARTEVPVEDFVAVASEVLRGQPFAMCAEPLLRVRVTAKRS